MAEESGSRSPIGIRIEANRITRMPIITPLLMPVAEPGRVYDGNDGGVDTSIDGGQTWENRSVGLGATMYYDLDVAPSDPLSFGGGKQDNGTNVTTTGASNDHFQILGGDGGGGVCMP